MNWLTPFIMTIPISPLVFQLFERFCRLISVYLCICIDTQIYRYNFYFSRQSSTASGISPPVFTNPSPPLLSQQYCPSAGTTPSFCYLRIKTLQLQSIVESSACDCQDVFNSFTGSPPFIQDQRYMLQFNFASHYTSFHYTGPLDEYMYLHIYLYIY